MTIEQEKEIIFKAQNKDRQALDVFFNHFKFFVQSIVLKQWARVYTDIDIEDKFQIGYMGLFRALKKFDLKRNVHFTTYSYYWINAFLGRFLPRETGNIKIPYGIRFKLYLRNKGNFKFDIENMNLYGLSLLQIKNMKMAILALRNMDSLEFEEEEEGKNYSSLSDKSFEEHQNKMDKVSFVKFVLSKKSIFEKNEFKVLDYLCGLSDGKIKTMAVVSKKIGLSRARVSQLVKKAVEKLRSVLTKCPNLV